MFQPSPEDLSETDGAKTGLAGGGVKGNCHHRREWQDVSSVAGCSDCGVQRCSYGSELAALGFWGRKYRRGRATAIAGGRTRFRKFAEPRQRSPR